MERRKKPAVHNDRYTILISKKLKEKFLEKCDDNGINPAEYIRNFIISYVD